MTTTLTRAVIAENIQKKLGFSFSESSEIVDSIVDEVCKAIAKDEVLKISSFGTFSVKSKKQRIGRNPKTKIEAVISPRKVIGFYSSSLLLKNINKK